MPRLPATLVLLAALLAWPAPSAHAQTPAAACVAIGTDDTPRPIPAELVPAVNAAFATNMPAQVALATTVFRCAGGHVLLCTTGANIPCGKANTSRAPGPGAIDWCRGHADSDSIPAFAVGHDTVYAWRCRGGAPEIARQALSVDARGFIAQFWKQLPPAR